MLKEVIQQKIKKNNVLSLCQIEITDFCNLKCVHCYLCDRSKNKTFNSLSLKVIMDIVAQLRQLNTFHITLTGGEPLTHPNIVEIARIIKSQNIHLAIMTNATLLTRELLSNLQPYVDKFVITCYGMSPKTYESVTRVKGSYTAYVKAIKMLEENKLNYKQRAFLLKENVCDAGLFAREKMLMDSNVCIDKNNNYAENSRISLDDQYRLFEKEIHSKTQTPHDIDFFEKSNHVVCNACQDSLFINCKGDIEPCVNFGYKLGDVYNGSIVDTWNGNARYELIEKLKLKYFIKCRSCNKLIYNTGICAADCLYETGDMHTPSEQCCQRCNMIYELMHKTGELV